MKSRPNNPENKDIHVAMFYLKISTFTCSSQIFTDPLSNELKGQSPDYAHPLFVKKTIELSYWRGKSSFQTAPPTEICWLHSQVIIKTFEEVFRAI